MVLGPKTRRKAGGEDSPLSTIDAFAQDYLLRAKERIIDASAALRRKSFPEVIRYSQEATELSLKAGLRLVGIEYPKVHDVGDVLIASSDRYPKWFATEIPHLARISRGLAEKRSAALYGVEAAGKTPGDLFKDPRLARQALKDSSQVRELCFRLLSSFAANKTTEPPANPQEAGTETESSANSLELTAEDVKGLKRTIDEGRPRKTRA